MFFWQMALPFRSFFRLFRGRRAAAAFISVCAGAALALLLGIGLAEAQSKQVLIIHSFGRNFLPWSEYGTAIRTELERQTNWPLSIQDHPLFTAASDDDNPDAAFAEYLRALYKRQAPHLILTIGAPAARFVQRHRASIFPTAPAVFTAVDQRFVQKDALTDYDTAVPVSIELLPLFQNILQLLPATKLIAVMLGNSPPERLWLNELQKELRALEGSAVVSYYTDRSFDDMVKIAAVLPPDSAIFWIQLRVDAAGIIHEGWGPLQRMYAAANAPIFSYDDTFFKGETVGGPMLSMTEVARKTASVAVRLLAGEKAANFNIEPIGLAPPRYDWRQLQRWHISESRLPPGSEIHFRSPTVWEQYRWQILAIATVLVLQAAMIAGLLYEHRRRRNAEIETRQRMSELAHLNRQATAGELSASIAHELNQPLGAILNNAESASVLLNSPSPDLEEIKTILDEIRRDDQRASEVIRRLRRLLGKSAIEVQNIDLNETVREVFELLSAQAAACNVTLSSRLAQGPLRVFELAVSQRTDALVVGNDTVFNVDRKRLAELAARRRLPATYLSREFVDDGGLMMFGVHYPDLYRRAATFVDKIFRGAKPADLPIEQPVKFELIVNLKAAKAIGLDIAPTMLTRADEVIE